MTRDFLGALESGLIGAFSAAIAFALYRWGEKPLGAGVQLALWFAAVSLPLVSAASRSGCFWRLNRNEPHPRVHRDRAGAGGAGEPLRHHRPRPGGPAPFVVVGRVWLRRQDTPTGYPYRLLGALQ